MAPLIASVVSGECVECRDQLLKDCRESGLPLPTGKVITVPESWAGYRCPHPGEKFRLDFLLQQSESADEILAASISWEDEDLEDLEAPDGWMNLDATKNIGYPAREQGRYGSHPSHDGFDDESEP
jgi:hypothetical protein